MDRKPSVWLVLAGMILGALLVSFLFTPLSAFGQSRGGENDRLVFTWSSLALPGTPTPGDLRLMWSASCHDLGGPDAKLSLSPSEAIIEGYRRVFPSIQGTCTVPEDDGIPAADSSA